MQYTLKEHFQRLQWKQDRHDALYHADIYTLSRKNNLTHMTMHLSKYLGSMISIYNQKDHEIVMLERLSVDFVIVLISMANRVNINLGDDIADEVNRFSNRTLDERTLYKDTDTMLNRISDYFGLPQFHNLDAKQFYLNVAVEIGKLSKAIEALDHLETFPSRDVIESSIHRLFRLIMNMRACQRFTQLGSYIWHRMKDLESKNILYEFLPKYIEDYKEV